MAGRIRQIIFRIFYSTSFTVVFLITVAFCCGGPIDAIYQSYRRGRYIDIFLMTGVYALVAIISVFLYSSRLYTNRTILKDIPKTYLPIEKGDLPGKRVWRLIEDCKSRSAVIAYQARPRARRIESELQHARERINTLLKPEHSKEYHVFEPQWGVINHPGWSGPGAAELPNLQYETVVAELTDLVEARAVSLIPADHDGSFHEDEGAIPNEYAIEALRKPEEIGMRDYIAQLVALGVLEDNSLSTAFLSLYERARFAPDPLTEDEFKTLMRIFAEILRVIKPLSLDKLVITASPDEFNDHRRQESFRGQGKNAASQSSSSLAESDVGSVRHHLRSDPPRMSNDSVRSFTSQDQTYEREQEREASPTWRKPTAGPPALRERSPYRIDPHGERPRSSRRTPNRERVPSSRSSVRARTSRNRVATTSNNEDRVSIRSGKSSASGGSVIRLKRDFDTSRSDLPFELTMTTERK